MANKKSPSRARYEQKRPTVSFRISEELKERLQTVKKAEGISTTEVLMRGVGLSEVKVKDEEQIRKEVSNKMYGLGFMAAKNQYVISFPCSRCGELIEANTPEIKEAIKRFLKDNGWGHSVCVR